LILIVENRCINWQREAIDFLFFFSDFKFTGNYEDGSGNRMFIKTVIRRDMGEY
jgi:hypothetical protein